MATKTTTRLEAQFRIIFGDAMVDGGSFKFKDLESDSVTIKSTMAAIVKGKMDLLENFGFKPGHAAELLLFKVELDTLEKWSRDDVINGEERDFIMKAFDIKVQQPELPAQNEIDVNNNFHHQGQLEHEFSAKKWEKMRSCLGYVLGKDGKKQSVTIFSSNAFLTYHHNSHSTWKIGERKIVFLDHETEVTCSVNAIFPSYDMIWLKPDKAPQWNYPFPSSYHQGQMFYLMGHSPRPPFVPNVKLGAMCSSFQITQESRKGFAYGDVQSIPGDSGGPCVDYYLGHLIGMSTGTYTFDRTVDNRHLRYGLLNMIVPSMTILGLIEQNDDMSIDPIYLDPHFIHNDP